MLDKVIELSGVDMKFESLEEFGNLVGSEGLDELVHDTGSRMASQANNGGVEEQLHYLNINGWSDEEILDQLNETFDKNDYMERGDTDEYL
jgi:hypothetical protein